MILKFAKREMIFVQPFYKKKIKLKILKRRGKNWLYIYICFLK